MGKTVHYTIVCCLILWYTSPVVPLGRSGNPELQGHFGGNAQKDMEGGEDEREVKLRNLQKVLSTIQGGSKNHAENGRHQHSSSAESAMLLRGGSGRSAGGRSEYPDLQLPRDARRISSSHGGDKQSQHLVEGSGLGGDQDDEDYVTWYGHDVTWTDDEDGDVIQGSGSGDDDLSMVTHIEAHLTPTRKGPEAVRPLWPDRKDSEDDNGGIFMTSEKHPDDVKKPQTKAGHSILNSGSCVWRTLLTIICIVCLHRTVLWRVFFAVD